MKDDSSFGNAPSTAGEPRKLFRQGATSNTFLTRYYGKLVLVKEIKPEYAGNMNYRMLFRKEFETGFSLNHPESKTAMCISWRNMSTASR